MTTLTPGSQIHFLLSSFTFVGHVGLGESSKRGQTITITAALVEHNRDREGQSFLDLSEDEQLARYGAIVWAPGPAPVDLLTVVPGSVEFELARDEARRIANAEADPAVRNSKLRLVDETFGRVCNPSAQRSSWTPSDTERDAELRRAGLR